MYSNKKTQRNNISEKEKSYESSSDSSSRIQGELNLTENDMPKIDLDVLNMFDNDDTEIIFNSDQKIETMLKESETIVEEKKIRYEKNIDVILQNKDNEEEEDEGEELPSTSFQTPPISEQFPTIFALLTNGTSVKKRKSSLSCSNKVNIPKIKRAKHQN